jgi:hypothetical protein
MMKITSMVCLLSVLLSCKKETEPRFQDFRFLDYSTQRPIEGVHVESTKGICIAGSNGNRGTCSNIYPYTAITGADGMARFADIDGNRLNTKHPSYYDLDRTENPFPAKNEYQLFLKAGVEIQLRYARTDITGISVTIDAPGWRDYLDKSGPLSFAPFFNPSETSVYIQPNSNQTSTYRELFGGIDNDISIFTSFASGEKRDTIIRVKPLPNQTTTLTANLQ